MGQLDPICRLSRGDQASHKSLSHLSEEVESSDTELDPVLYPEKKKG